MGTAGDSSRGRRTAADAWRNDNRKQTDYPAILPILVIAAGTLVYLNSFSGVFLLDDSQHILENPRIYQLWPPWHVLSGTRPVVDVSLAINYAIGGFEVWGYHFVNLAIHILAALTLFGVVRRSLTRVSPPSRLASSAPWLALLITLIWEVHPLQTQSVTYIIQRGEAMMGLFYLLTLYCMIRGVDSLRSHWWYAAAVVCCASGMGSKAVMVTAPIVVALYDWAFITRSVRELFRRRWILYTGLASTWIVLWLCGVVRGVFYSSDKLATVGFAFKGITPWEYASTEPGVIQHYLRLLVFPSPLCLDYDWPVARSIGDILGPVAVIVLLLAGTSWALVYRPRLGFLGACFFVTLAPTSSLVPVKDLAFEHRMYLPLAAMVILLVLAGNRALADVVGRLSLARTARRMITIVSVLAIVGFLGYGTVRRNRDYQSEVTMWQDVLTKRPKNARGHLALGASLYKQQKFEDAIARFRDAVSLKLNYATAHYNLGNALYQTDRFVDAAAEYRDAVRINPREARTHRSLGNALMKLGEFDGAARAYREALRIDPNQVSASVNLGDALFRLGRVDKAVGQYRQALQVDPFHATARNNLGAALVRQGNIEDGVGSYREALHIDPDYVDAHFNLATALNSQGKLDEARAEFRVTLRLKPDHARALAALEAIRHIETSSDPN